MNTHFQIFLLLTFTIAIAADPPGFLSLSCGASSPFSDSSSISWTPDSSYIATGNATSINSTSIRFFPDSDPGTRLCYRLPLLANVSTVLIRASFIYQNYNGLGRPPAFSVSLGPATATVVNLSQSDPLIEEFVWRVDNDKNTLPFCLHSVADGGFPVISSLEVRPLPESAYGASSDGRSLLRKRERISCGYVGSVPLR